MFLALKNNNYIVNNAIDTHLHNHVFMIVFNNVKIIWM